MEEYAEISARWQDTVSELLHRLLWKLLRLTLLLAFLCGVGYAFYVYLKGSPLFILQTICVDGANVLKEDEIITSSGLTSADNLLFMNINEVKSKIEAMPYVKLAKVDRFFPSTIAITIMERRPVATLIVEDKMYEIDDEGIVLREINPETGHSVGAYITNIPNLGCVELGKKVQTRELQRALAVWHAMNRVPMSQDITISEISAQKENDIIMYCDELPFSIKWGRGDFDSQARRLNFLWHKKGRQLSCAEYLDLRFDNDLICR